MECRACGLLFSSDSSFRKHRTGSYGNPIYKGRDTIGYTKHERRCLTEEEMIDLKMCKTKSKDGKDIWITERFEGNAFWQKEEKA